MKTDPASSTRSNKKGLNDNNNRLLGIVNKLCSPFGYSITNIIIYIAYINSLISFFSEKQRKQTGF